MAVGVPDEREPLQHIEGTPFEVNSLGEITTAGVQPGAQELSVHEPSPAARSSRSEGSRFAQQRHQSPSPNGERDEHPEVNVVHQQTLYVYATRATEFFLRRSQQE
jgi:hypothetical protein